MARPQKIRLGELLVENNLLTSEQLAEALSAQSGSGRKLGRVLVENGYVSERQIAEAVSKQMGIAFIDMKFFSIRETEKKLPETQARKLRALVIGEENGLPKVVLSDPTDILLYDEITRLLNSDFIAAAATESDILSAIDKAYQRREEIAGFAKELAADIVSSVEIGDSAEPGAEDAPVVKLLQSVFEDAAQSRASDIHIEPQRDSTLIRFRIDGKLYERTTADAKIAAPLLLRLKLMSGLDISEKRTPQDGRFPVKVHRHDIDVRLSTMPTHYGESAVMRLLRQDNGLLSLDKTGMPAHFLKRFKKHISKPEGMILVTGPTGSGKTTTLYSVLAELNTPDRKILTIEDPVEYQLPRVNQIQVNEKIELDFAKVLRAALRQDPDVIMIGEMRDQETSQIGLRASITGHLILSTLHTKDTISTATRLIDMGTPPYMLSTALQCVLAQRLVRLSCQNCLTHYTPDDHDLDWLKGVAKSYDGWTFKRGNGCEHCNGTGYSGRVGVYELLEMDGKLRDALHRSDMSEFTKLATESLGDMTMMHGGLELVKNGRTTIDEIRHSGIVSWELE